MEDSRNNIMFRKIRPYSGRNCTTDQLEYLKSVERINSLKKKRQEIGEHLRIVNYGTREEKNKLKESIRNDADVLLEIKNQKILQEKEFDIKEHQKIIDHQKLLLEIQAKKEEEKKQIIKKVQMDNYIAFISKSHEKISKKVMEDMIDRECIHKSISNYNPNVM
jgi:hypothetical protein